MAWLYSSSLSRGRDVVVETVCFIVLVFVFVFVSMNLHVSALSRSRLLGIYKLTLLPHYYIYVHVYVCVYVYTEKTLLNAKRDIAQWEMATENILTYSQVSM